VLFFGKCQFFRKHFHIGQRERHYFKGSRASIAAMKLLDTKKIVCGNLVRISGFEPAWVSVILMALCKKSTA
jgi:hypothetical protein